jgi:hypothetical protein
MEQSLSPAGVLFFQNTRDIGSVLPHLVYWDATNAWQIPYERGKQADANWQTPNMIPQLSTVLSVYNAGGCTFQELNFALRNLGILTAGHEIELATGGMWTQFVNTQQPRITVDQALRADILGKAGREDLDTTIKRNGYRNSKDREIIKKDSLGLGLADLIVLWWSKQITDEDFTKWIRYLGYRNDDIIRLIKTVRTSFSLNQAIQLFWAGSLSWDDIIHNARRAGIVANKDLDSLNELQFTWPSAGTVLGWSAQNVFDPPYVNRMGLDLEKDAEVEYFLRKTGLSFNPATQRPRDWPLPGISTGDLYWRAHWKQLDIGTATLLLHRLRPTGGPNNGPRVPGVAPFTDDNFKEALKVNEWPQGVRDQLAAVTDPTLPRLVGNRMFQYGIITFDELVETYKDQGYSPKNAFNLATLARVDNTKALISKIKPLTIHQIKEAYKVGIIDRQTAGVNLLIATENNPSRIENILSMPASEQSNLAALDPFIQLTLKGLDAEIAAELTAKAIEVFHKGYLRGELSVLQAQAGLVRLGIVVDRANQYIQLWTYELMAEGTEVAASKLLGWYTDHLIDVDTLRARLEALHYRPGDVSLMIAAANIKLSEQAQKLADRTAKAKSQQDRQIAAALKANLRSIAGLQKQLCKSGNRAQLAKWATLQLIPYPEAYQRLLQCGMTGQDAIALLATTAKVDGQKGIDEIVKKVGPLASAQSTNGKVATTT